MMACLVAALGLKLLVIGHAINPAGYPYAREPILTTIGVLALVAVPLLALNTRARACTALGINAVVTLIALADLWYFRFDRQVLSIADINGWWQLRVVFASLRALVQPVDLLALADVAIVGAVLVVRWRRPLFEPPRLGLAIGLFLTGLIAITPILSIAHDDREAVFEYAFQQTEVVGAAGLAGYHVYDVVQLVLRPALRRWTVSSAQTTSAADYLRARNAQRFESSLAGSGKGLNVIVLSAESLQAFVIGLSSGGQPVAPHLEAFARESLHFTSFYDQTHRSTTSDAEFIALNSLMPLPFGAVATRYSSNSFRSLPHVLTERGYSTLSACAEPPSFWNMGRIHPRLGFERSLFDKDFRATRWVGSGLDDAAFLDEMADVLKAERTPFFSYLISSSNHHPFDLPPDLRRLPAAALPAGMAGDYLQSVRHFDEAFGRFVARLAANGLLERSIVVVFGDHHAGLAESELLQLWTAAGHEHAPSALELWQFRRKVPLLIRLPHGASAGVRDTPGGHLDITPTLISLLGVEALAGPWLGRDLTSPTRNLVVFRDGSITDDAATAIGENKPSRGCFANSNDVIPCRDLDDLSAEARRLLSASDTIVEGNVAPHVTAKLAARASLPPRELKRVMVIAHRGDSLHYPENTLESIRAAFDLGADAVEVDVRITSDGVPFLFHDDTLERTSTGSGVPEKLTLREMAALDAGRWFAARFAGTRIPTLEAALRVAHGRGSLLLDLKAEGLAPAIREVYKRVGADPSEALIGGWTPSQRADFVREMPGARVLKTEAAPVVWGEPLFGEIRAQGLWGFEIGDYWPAPFIADATLHDVPVIAYTINDEPTLTRLVEAGVSGIETDDPGLLLRIARRLGRR